jgi:translation initiation factor eIF-2B subunit gamma
MGLNRDFQAVLMAGGKGSRMTDLSSSKLKCLLPVGNFPMLYYPLSLLQKIGCKDVIVIVPEVAKSEVIAMPKKYGLDLCLDVVTISQQEDDCGTADSLRRVHDKITAQTVFVLSSDLFTDLRVHQLVDLHRVHQSSVTALFAKNSINMKAIPVPGPKAKVKRERDIIGIDHQKIGGGGQICYWSSDADLDEDITIKRPVLQEHPNFKVYSNLTDAHFYIFEKWVVDFIVHDE